MTMKLQQRSQPIPQGALKLGWSCRDGEFETSGAAFVSLSAYLHVWPYFTKEGVQHLPGVSPLLSWDMSKNGNWNVREVHALSCAIVLQ